MQRRPPTKALEGAGSIPSTALRASPRHLRRPGIAAPRPHGSAMQSSTEPEQTQRKWCGVCGAEAFGYDTLCWRCGGLLRNRPPRPRHRSSSGSSRRRPLEATPPEESAIRNRGIDEWPRAGDSLEQSGLSSSSRRADRRRRRALAILMGLLTWGAGIASTLYGTQVDDRETILAGLALTGLGLITTAIVAVFPRN